MGQLVTSLADIEKLGLDKHIYRFATTDDNESSISKGEDGVININGTQGVDAMYVHEIRHVSEALNSKEELTFEKSTGRLFYQPTEALQRETSAYKAQYSYAPNSISGVRSINQINERLLGTMVKSDGTALYPVIADGWNKMPKFVQDQFP